MVVIFQNRCLYSIAGVKIRSIQYLFDKNAIKFKWSCLKQLYFHQNAFKS